MVICDLTDIRLRRQHFHVTVIIDYIIYCIMKIGELLLSYFAFLKFHYLFQIFQSTSGKSRLRQPGDQKYIKLKGEKE